MEHDIVREVAIKEGIKAFGENWSIYENAEGVSSFKLAPFGSPITFEIVSMTHRYRTGVNSERYSALHGPKEVVYMRLKPADNIKGSSHRYSLLGTNRTVDDITATIEPVDNESEITCFAEADIAYKSSYSEPGEYPFQYNDYLLFCIKVSESEFRRLLELLKHSTKRNFHVTFEGVAGLYAPESFMREAHELKVLTKCKELIIKQPEGSMIEPFYIGQVEAAKIIFSNELFTKIETDGIKEPLKNDQVETFKALEQSEPQDNHSVTILFYLKKLYRIAWISCLVLLGILIILLF